MCFLFCESKKKANHFRPKKKKTYTIFWIWASYPQLTNANHAWRTALPSRTLTTHRMSSFYAKYGNVYFIFFFVVCGCPSFTSRCVPARPRSLWLGWSVEVKKWNENVQAVRMVCCIHWQCQYEMRRTQQSVVVNSRREHTVNCDLIRHTTQWLVWHVLIQCARVWVWVSHCRSLCVLPSVSHTRSLHVARCICERNTADRTVDRRQLRWWLKRKTTHRFASIE